MGFKYKKVTFTLGTDTFPHDRDDTSKALLRAQTIVKSVAQALIDMNIGWGLDSRHSSITDFKNIPDYSYGDWATALFLVNSESGCKLFLGYASGIGSTGINVSDDFIVKTYNSSYTSNAGCVSGLVMSMIPGTSTSVFGTTASDLIPSDATRITGTVITNANPSYRIITYIYNNDPAGTIYGYGVCATDSVVGILWLASDTIMWPRCFCGKILDNLAHNTDNSLYSKYGTICFICTPGGSSGCTENSGGYRNSTSGETTYNIASDKTSPAYGSINARFTYLVDYGYADSNYICGGNSVCKADGTWISNTANTGVCLRIDNFLLYSTMLQSFTSSPRRWQPYMVVIVSNDPDTYGVIQGDGVKGYLDTTLFRCANVNYGTLYDNGNFIGLYEGCLLGWDPDNDPL